MPARKGLRVSLPEVSTFRLIYRALTCLLLLVFLLAPKGIALGAVHYVDVKCTHPVPPFSEWSSAATNIQDAVDIAEPGDTITVTNGIYDWGGRSVDGLTTNRVAVDKPLVLQSVNGPEFTVIQAFPWPQYGFEMGIRCVFLADGATLSGFTLASGAAESGGGVLCQSTNAVLSNCVIVASYAFFAGGGSSSGSLYNCRLAGNYTEGNGGGADQALLVDCVVEENISNGRGGGACDCTLFSCIVTNNTVCGDGGGVYGGSVFESTIADNEICYGFGAGASSSTLVKCTLTGNRPVEEAPMQGGGGAFGSSLYDCVITNNSAEYAGGAYASVLYNCLLIDNYIRGVRYGGAAGGAGESSLYNCILARNVAGIGAGAGLCLLSNCLVTGNSACGNPWGGGGGVWACTLFNCLVASNTICGLESGDAGGAYFSALFNCTLAANSGLMTGGASGCAAVNCIVYYNEPLNWKDCAFDDSCTTPDPGSGTGNITADPGFVDPQAGDYHLDFGSPCINTGTNQDWMSNATDLQGNSRILLGIVDRGAYEYAGTDYAMALKQEVLASLRALEKSIAGTVEAAQLENSITHLETSLDPISWLDQSHLVWNHGAGVMHQDKDAVKELEGLLWPRQNTIPRGTLENLIRRILKVDRFLALVSIREAVELKPSKIAEDMKELEAGDSKAAQGKYHEAIQHYCNAWRHAVHLTIREINSLPDGACRIKFLGLENTVYAIEFSTDLQNWSRIGTGTANSEGLVEFTDPAGAAKPVRFYRTVEF